jgi:hypothetical protein
LKHFKWPDSLKMLLFRLQIRGFGRSCENLQSLCPWKLKSSNRL